MKNIKALYYVSGRLLIAEPPFGTHLSSIPSDYYYLVLIFTVSHRNLLVIKKYMYIVATLCFVVFVVAIHLSYWSYGIRRQRKSN